MSLDQMKRDFEAWVRRTYPGTAAEAILLPGPGKWHYQSTHTEDMLDAFRAGVRSQLPDSTD